MPRDCDILLFNLETSSWFVFQSSRWPCTYHSRGSGLNNLLQVTAGLPPRRPGISHCYQSGDHPSSLHHERRLRHRHLTALLLISRNFLLDEWGRCFGSRALGLGAERQAYTDLAPSRRTDCETVNRALRVHFEK